jgi:hypothetical protein
VFPKLSILKMQMTNNKVHSYNVQFDFSILQMEIPDNQFHGYVVFLKNLTIHQMEIPDIINFMAM